MLLKQLFDKDPDEKIKDELIEIINNRKNNRNKLKRSAAIRIDLSYLILLSPIIIIICIGILRGLSLIDLKIDYYDLFLYSNIINVIRFFGTSLKGKSFHKISSLHNFSINIILFLLIFIPFTFFSIESLGNYIVQLYKANPTLFDSYSNFWGQYALGDVRISDALESFTYNPMEVVNVFTIYGVLFFNHLALVFYMQYIVGRDRKILYFLNCGIEPKLIAEFIFDPDNNKKTEAEALYRYANPSKYLNDPDKNLKVEEKPPYRYVNSSQSKITQSMSNFESESVQKINNNFGSTDLAYSRNEIFKIVKLITSNQLKLDSSNVTINSDFKNDLRADDIEIAEIIIDMENYFEIKISNEDADSFNTIGDVVIFIEKNI